MLVKCMSQVSVLVVGTAVTAGADSSNEGRIDLENASALKVAGNFTNSGLLLTALNGGMETR